MGQKVFKKTMLSNCRNIAHNWNFKWLYDSKLDLIKENGKQQISFGKDLWKNI